MDSTPGVCGNIDGCDLAKAGRPALVELHADFRCPECGTRLVAPVLPAPRRRFLVPILAGAALLLGVACSIAAWHASMPRNVPSPILVAVQQLSPPAAGSVPPPSASTVQSAVLVAPPAVPALPVATLFDRPFSPTPTRGGAPNYPASLAADGRPGRVLVNCVILSSGKPAHCTAKPERGGNAFSPAVLAWLRSGVVFAPIVRDGHVVEETHHWPVTVAESLQALRRARSAVHRVPQPKQQPFSGMAVNSSRPDFPDEYAAEDHLGAVKVDCLIGVHGEASDCHAGRISGTARFRDAVMRWLSNPRTKFAPLIRNGHYVATRRTWEIQYIP